MVVQIYFIFQLFKLYRLRFLRTFLVLVYIIKISLMFERIWDCFVTDTKRCREASLLKVDYKCHLVSIIKAACKFLSFRSQGLKLFVGRFFLCSRFLILCPRFVRFTWASGKWSGVRFSLLHVSHALKDFDFILNKKSSKS